MAPLDTKADCEEATHLPVLGSGVSALAGRVPMTSRRLNILQINSHETAGGAETVVSNLRRAYSARGHTAWSAVGYRSSGDPDVLDFPVPSRSLPWLRLFRIVFRRTAGLDGRVPGMSAVRSRLLWLASGWAEVDPVGFRQPNATAVLRLPPSRPDIIHCHNLHSGYFDLRLLPLLSGSVPVFLTLHDAWLLSGHCAHSFDCQRWRIGCGHCPDLSIYPSIRYDSSGYNWRRKQAVFSKSDLFVATPSHWLMDKVRDSMLSSAIVDARVVPNGIDLSVFQPYPRRKARAELKLPQETRVLLAVANNLARNIWKDYKTLVGAFSRASKSLSESQVLLIVLGDQAPSEQVETATIRFIRYTADARTVARYFQAADVYVHAAKVDTFPSTVLEALACGTPVIATKVGGIPEQIEDGVTGYLVPIGDPVILAERIVRLLSDDGLRRAMSIDASTSARQQFDLARQVDYYLEWYQEVLKNWRLEYTRARSIRD